MSVEMMSPRRGMGHRPIKGTGRVYAIAYDLNNDAAERHGAWGKIARVLESHGFRRQQGSVFYGDENTSAMTCARAVLELYDKYAWFWEVVRDMRINTNFDYIVDGRNSLYLFSVGGSMEF